MLYCDTSALLKLYIEEANTSRLQSRVAEADAVVVCRIAWAEAFAALARRAREVPEDRPVIEAAKAALTTDWPHYVVLEVSQSVVERAGDYADTFALRGYDSVQLAAAFEAGRIAETIIDFACFDVRLNKAAQVLGMRVLDAA
ncbi:MAG: type II toxin-antitoxin system VapC family toxin [Pseudomonadota bacterium]|nr:type II toxin-antitoxin system VapC family toxin [Pseudomonadota bacterium]